MRFLKYFLIFSAVSIGLSVLLYILAGGRVLFLLGGIPLGFGGFWSFGGRRRVQRKIFILIKDSA